MGYGARAVAVIAALLSIAHLASRPASSQEDEASAPEPVDEIIVYGEKSLTRLRYEFNRAKEDFFDTFNALNTDDDLDIDCDYVTFVGDRRRHHLCIPVFATKAEVDSTLAMLIGAKMDCVLGCTGAWTDTSGYPTRVRRKDEQLRQELVALVTAHPELRALYEELAKRKQMLEAERARR